MAGKKRKTTAQYIADNYQTEAERAKYDSDYKPQEETQEVPESTLSKTLDEVEENQHNRDILDQATVPPGEADRQLRQAEEMGVKTEGKTKKQIRAEGQEKAQKLADIKNMPLEVYDAATNLVEKIPGIGKKASDISKAFTKATTGYDSDTGFRNTPETITPLTEEEKQANAENEQQMIASNLMQQDIDKAKVDAASKGEDVGLATMEAKDKIAEETKTKDNQYDVAAKEEYDKRKITTPSSTTSKTNPTNPTNPTTPSSTPSSTPWEKLYEDYKAPKNGADYLKRLWSQGAGGKAQAIGNVLGNLIGSTGAGLAGKDYESDWEKYKNNYIAAEQERNQKQFDTGMDLLKRAETNKQDLQFLQDSVNKKMSMAKNMSAEDRALLQSFNAALSGGDMQSLLMSLGGQGIAKVFSLLGL